MVRAPIPGGIDPAVKPRWTAPGWGARPGVEAPATWARYRLSLRPLVERATWTKDFGVFWPVIVLNADGTAPP